MRLTSYPEEKFAHKSQPAKADDIRQGETRPMARHTLMNSLLLGGLVLTLIALIAVVAS
ncbi:MAG: hypothetical protein MRY64_04865 [Hyphomonadaceae bacterium]|nr:hypothetical protein [Hyphomonadaceae bacterium]